MSEPAIHRKENRAKLVELIFEKLNFEQIFISKSPVLSSFSVGCTTSLVFDSGESITYAVPVHDGYISQSMIQRSKVAGNIVTDGLKNFLSSQSISINPLSILESENYELKDKKLELSALSESAQQYHIDRMLKKIKSELLECSLDPLAKRDPSYKFESKTYTLPDETKIDVNGDQFKIPEILFLSEPSGEEAKNEPEGDAEMPEEDPYKQKLDGFNGFQNLVQKSINTADMDIRRDLYKNILCTGGNTLLKNFEDRFVKEIQEIAPQNYTVNFIKKRTTSFATDEVLYSPFIGASILSSLSSFKHMWFTRQEYSEHGAGHIEKKCP